MSKVKQVDVLMSERPYMNALLVKSCPTCFQECFTLDESGALLFQQSVDSVVLFLSSIQQVITKVNDLLAGSNLTPYQENLYLSWACAYDKYAHKATEVRNSSRTEYDCEDTMDIGADYIALFSIVYDNSDIRSYAIEGLAHAKT